MPHPAEPALRWAPERLLSSTGPRPGALLSNLRFLLLAPRAGRAAGPLAPAQPWRPVPAVAASLLAHLALILAVFLQPRPPAVERHLVFVREAVPIYWYGPPPRLRPAAPSRTPANFRAFHPHAMVWFAPPRPTNRWQTLIEPAAPPEAPRWVPPAQNIVAWPQPELPVLAAAAARCGTARCPTSTRCRCAASSGRGRSPRAPCRQRHHRYLRRIACAAREGRTGAGAHRPL